MKKLVLAALLSGCWAASLQARMIASDFKGEGDELLFIGQSFTTTAAAFDNISFSFFDPGGARQALGTAYLFSAAYTGTPDGLAAASANLLGSAVGDGSAYTFDSSLRLDASTRYYLYSDTQMNLLGGGSYYDGGSFSSAGAASDSFSADSLMREANFILNGEFADLTVLDDAPVAVEALAGSVLSTRNSYWGQSFTTGDGALNNISFNFYGADGSPLALGTAYLFSAPHFGQLQFIQTATTNLVGKSIAGGGSYIFDPAMQLAPNTKYYLYTDARMTIFGNGVSSIPGSEFWESDDLGTFLMNSGDTNFTVRGTALAQAVPEPAGWAMMIIGFGSVGAAMRSARRRPRGAAIG